MAGNSPLSKMAKRVNFPIPFLFCWENSYLTSKWKFEGFKKNIDIECAILVFQYFHSVRFLKTYRCVVFNGQLLPTLTLSLRRPYPTILSIVKEKEFTRDKWRRRWRTNWKVPTKRSAIFLLLLSLIGTHEKKLWYLLRKGVAVVENFTIQTRRTDTQNSISQWPQIPSFSEFAFSRPVLQAKWCIVWSNF